MRSKDCQPTFPIKAIADLLRLCKNTQVSDLGKLGVDLKARSTKDDSSVRLRVRVGRVYGEIVVPILQHKLVRLIAFRIPGFIRTKDFPTYFYYFIW